MEEPPGDVDAESTGKPRVVALCSADRRVRKPSDTIVRKATAGAPLAGAGAARPRSRHVDPRLAEGRHLPEEHGRRLDHRQRQQPTRGLTQPQP